MAQNGYFSSTQTLQSTPSSFTAGSVVFQGNGLFLAQDNANFFWDDVNIRLGIGTNTPTSSLQILANYAGNVNANVTNTNTSSSNSVGYNITNDAGTMASFTLFGNNFANAGLNNAARLANTKSLWLVSDVNNASGGTDNIYFSVGGYNNVTAQATPNGLTAINLTDTGIASSNAGAPLSITSGQVITAGITATEITATANATTTSATNALITGMTVTPAAGTYLVLFSAGVQISNAGSTVTLSLYVGGTQKADSVRPVAPFDGGSFSAGQASCGVSINSIVTVNGSQAIAVYWNTSGGTATCFQRTLDIVRVS